MSPEQGFDLAAAVRHGAAELLLWLRAEVLLGPVLAQLAVGLLFGAAAMAAASWLRPRLAVELARWDVAPPLRRVLRLLLALLRPLLALALLSLAATAFRQLGLANDLLRGAATVVALWVVLRATSVLLKGSTLAKLISFAAFVWAGLTILDLLDPALALLDAMAMQIGTTRISVLLVGQTLLTLGILLWLAGLLSHLFDRRIAALPDLSPAMQVLVGKLMRGTLIAVAVLLALGLVGVDLTALAVFSGALGLGLGFGLQKVVSNLFSGVILLLDRSIKPGDVIELEGTYGWISRLNARYVSVVTRDSTEYLIPNEDLITHQVINWSYTNDLIRLHVPVRVAYRSDPRLAIDLCIQAVAEAPRAMADPAPVCLLTEFGEDGFHLELRFWIRDPQNGTRNVRSQVMLAIWDRFQAHDIRIPHPKRDLWLRGVDPEVREAWKADGQPPLRPEKSVDGH